MILLLVMLSLLSGGLTEVVQDFQETCGDFFLFGKAPTVLNGPQYRQICQTLYNTYHFATLYDTNNKIPVYSAYVFEGWMDCKRQNRWYIEPQLDDNNGGENMKKWDWWVFDNQASNEDYAWSGFDKGHLAPVYHASSQRCSDATFTLTNAAPQDSKFNRGQWKKVEKDMSSTVNRLCRDSTAYIVTGVVPGNININNRVTVPSHFWTAYCCQSRIMEILISGGVIGINSEENLPPDQISVIDLEAELTNLYNVQSFRLFDDKCRDAVYFSVTNRKRRRLKFPFRLNEDFTCGNINLS